MSLRHKLLCSVVIVLLSACSSPDMPHDGMGGTGQIAANDGMGGTGQIANGEDGIGGTGQIATGSGIGGTGIVGTVTGFGSIFVNGVEVEIDQYSKMKVNYIDSPFHQIAIGEVVEVQAEIVHEETHARKINIRHEVIGPIDSININRLTLTVLGQEIRTTKSDIRMLSLGGMVQISGLRDAQGIIHSSKIISTSSKQLWLIGKIATISANTISIGGANIVVGNTQKLNVGNMVRVRASYKKGRIVASQVIVGANPFIQHVNRIIVQGFIYEGNSGHYVIGATAFSSRSARIRSELDDHQGHWLRVALVRTDMGLWRAVEVINKHTLRRGRAAPRSTLNPNHGRPSRTTTTTRVIPQNQNLGTSSGANSGGNRGSSGGNSAGGSSGNADGSSTGNSGSNTGGNSSGNTGRSFGGRPGSTRNSGNTRMAPPRTRFNPGSGNTNSGDRRMGGGMM